MTSTKCFLGAEPFIKGEKIYYFSDCVCNPVPVYCAECISIEDMCCKCLKSGSKEWKTYKIPVIFESTLLVNLKDFTSYEDIRQVSLLKSMKGKDLYPYVKKEFGFDSDSFYVQIKNKNLSIDEEKSLEELGVVYNETISVTTRFRGGLEYYIILKPLFFK